MIPKTIAVPGCEPIPIVRKKLTGKLGYWDERKGEIGLCSSLNDAEASCILVHELLHACETALLQSGVMKRRSSHDFIHNLAPNLLLLLVAGKLWKGCSARAYYRFYADKGKATPKHKKIQRIRANRAARKAGKRHA